MSAAAAKKEGGKMNEEFLDRERPILHLAYLSARKNPQLKIT